MGQNFQGGHFACAHLRPHSHLHRKHQTQGGHGNWEVASSILVGLAGELVPAPDLSKRKETEK